MKYEVRLLYKQTGARVGAAVPANQAMLDRIRARYDGPGSAYIVEWREVGRWQQ